MNNLNQKHEWQWQLFVLILKEAAIIQNISKVEIANKTGYSPSTIGRVFNLEFCPKLQLFLDISRALQLNIFFETRNSETDLNLAFEKAMESLGRRPDKLPKN